MARNGLMHIGAGVRIDEIKMLPEESHGYCVSRQAALEIKQGAAIGNICDNPIFRSIDVSA